MDIPSFMVTCLSYVQSFWWACCLVALIPMLIMGIFTAKLARKKGYSGYFFTGFFFNFIGLIYVVGLPLAKDRCDRAKLSDLQ